MIADSIPDLLNIAASRHNVVAGCQRSLDNVCAHTTPGAGNKPNSLGIHCTHPFVCLMPSRN
jgi:hypothetical protein